MVEAKAYGKALDFFRKQDIIITIGTKAAIMVKKV